MPWRRDEEGSAAVSRYAYEAELDHVVSFPNGSVAVQWRMRDGKLAVIDSSASRVTSNRIMLDASGLPVFVAGVNYGDDTDGMGMTAALRTAWPTARTVFVDARGSWQGTDIAYFDVALDSM